MCVSPKKGARMFLSRGCSAATLRWSDPGTRQHITIALLALSRPRHTTPVRRVPQTSVAMYGAVWPGRDHPDVAAAACHLGEVYLGAGDADRAHAMFASVVGMLTRLGLATGPQGVQVRVSGLPLLHPHPPLPHLPPLVPVKPSSSMGCCKCETVVQCLVVDCFAVVCGGGGYYVVACCGPCVVRVSWLPPTRASQSLRRSRPRGLRRLRVPPPPRTCGNMLSWRCRSVVRPTCILGMGHHSHSEPDIACLGGALF
jgi:hypothetical protein